MFRAGADRGNGENLHLFSSGCALDFDQQPVLGLAPFQIKGGPGALRETVFPKGENLHVGRGGCSRGNAEGNVSGPRKAGFRTDVPFEFSFENKRSLGNLGRRLNHDGKEDFALVNIGENVALGLEGMGQGPLDGARGKSRGKFPLDLGRGAGIPRSLPVKMPAVRELKTDADGEGFASGDCCGVGKERGHRLGRTAQKLRGGALQEGKQQKQGKKRRAHGVYPR